MPTVKDATELQEPLAKSRSLGNAERTRLRIEGDYTVVNLDALRETYKLSAAYARIRNLEMRAPEKYELETFEAYRKRYVDVIRPQAEFRAQPRPKYPKDEAYRDKRVPSLYTGGDVVIIVNDALYGAVNASLDSFVLDLGRDGYWATVHTVRFGTPTAIRSYLASLKPVGAILVGSIAAPWFSHANDFHGATATFPCDLYYMDTNGQWVDSNNDGQFDGHDGQVNPEIWVGRLWTPTADGNDAALINDYFARNHQFRTGALGHARSGLSFVDDDWQGFDDCELDQMLPPTLITKYTDPNTTDADLYRAEVNSLRSWVQLCAHSWPLGHALKVPAQNASEYIQVQYFRDTNPPNAHFYNLFCCGPGLYTTPDYLAGWYLFDKGGGGTNSGLAVIASAKSGSMLFFADFYRPMGPARKPIGDAFVDWWKARGPDHDDGERSWYYGLTLLGDPTLTWWKGAVPRLIHPQDGDVFDHWPRKMQFRWHPVELDKTVYSVEVDYFTGQWAEASGGSTYLYHNVAGTTLDHVFVGAQPGRWRVRAVVDGTPCSWSPWSYFRYTV
jgi:hypothetical protein